MGKVTKDKQAPKSCQECEHWAEVRNKLRASGVLAKVIKTMEEKLKLDEFKPSLADYLKLIQLEKEIGGDETKEIKVTWVEPDKSSTET